MPSRKYTFTAVLTNYNHSRYLPAALGMVIGQTVPFDEIIIIDDGSTDDSVAVIERHIQGVPQARLVRNPGNMGVVPSLNVGLNAAAGDYLFHFAADDVYSANIVEGGHDFLSRYPGVAMISGNSRLHRMATGEQRTFTLPFPQTPAVYTGKDLESVAKKRNVTFFGGANITRRDAMLACGGFLETLGWHCDWFLYLAIAYRYGFGVIPEEFVSVRVSEGQYSHACHDWARQRPVIEALVETVLRDYPDLLPLFREHALLPTYEPRMLALLLGKARLRPYLTPLLAWRLLSYKPMRAAGRLVPSGLRERARRFARV